VTDRPRRLVFLGTPDAAVPSLRAVQAAGFEVALVVSRPDRRRRRSAPAEPSPIKAAALELDLTVSDDLDQAVAVDADLGVVVAYGRIIPASTLARLPMVNLHFSLLPRWRGAAPVERAILAGDHETGVCVMDVAEGLDEGGVHAVARTAISSADTAASLTDRLAGMGADLLTATLATGLGPAVPQDGAVTYAEKITQDDRHLDWSRAAEELHRVVRVGRAWTTFRGARLLVATLEAVEGDAGNVGLAPGEVLGALVGTGTGPVRLLEVQPEGRERQTAADWVNGARPGPGEQLGG
jgi:methionyl-tRNA formyltransferase